MKTEKNIELVIFACSQVGIEIDQERAGKILHDYMIDHGSRSSAQLALYWGSWLEIIFDNFPEAIGDPKKKEDAHEWLKFVFCHTKRTDLFTERRARLMGKVEKVLIPFSVGLDELKVADMQEYLDFVKTWTKNNIGVEL